MADKTIADKFKEALAAINDDAVKTTLLENFNEVNRKAGEYGAKLMTKDSELAELKGKLSEAGEKEKTWSKSYETLKKANINPDEIPEILERLGVQKTLEEEHELIKAALEEKNKAFTKVEKELHRSKAEKAIKDIFEKQRAELKDEKGQVVKIANGFINLEKLYDVTDLANETVLKEKCKQVLTEALTKQTETLRDIGFQGAVLPNTQAQGQQQNSQVSTGLNQIKEIYDKGGPEAAIHADRQRRGAPTLT